MIGEDIDDLSRLVDAADSARRRLVSAIELQQRFALRLSELRGLEIACEAADEAIAAFHWRRRGRGEAPAAGPADCEIAGIDAARFIPCALSRSWRGVSAVSAARLRRHAAVTPPAPR